MHRTQLLLEPWQYDALKALAEGQDESISALVRRAVAEFLGAKGGTGAAQERRRARLEDIEGLFDDPGGAARDHDAHIYGAPKRRR